jgi:mono/diheme cytochrome c family protein
MLTDWSLQGGKAWRLALLIACLLLSRPELARPAAGAPGDAERGQQLYRRYCAVCHGLEGTGAGRNAPYLERLGRAPRDHTDLEYMQRLNDAELYRAISEGKLRDGEPPFMPWWGYTLTPQQIWDLVAFIRRLAREPAP